MAAQRQHPGLQPCWNQLGRAQSHSTGLFCRERKVTSKAGEHCFLICMGFLNLFCSPEKHLSCVPPGLSANSVTVICSLLSLLSWPCCPQVLYKENVGMGTPTPVTPEMERVKRNQEHVSSVSFSVKRRTFPYDPFKYFNTQSYPCSPIMIN